MPPQRAVSRSRSKRTARSRTRSVAEKVRNGIISPSIHTPRSATTVPVKRPVRKGKQVLNKHGVVASAPEKNKRIILLDDRPVEVTLRESSENGHSFSVKKLDTKGGGKEISLYLDTERSVILSDEGDLAIRDVSDNGKDLIVSTEPVKTPRRGARFRDTATIWMQSAVIAILLGIIGVQRSSCSINQVATPSPTDLMKPGVSTTLIPSGIKAIMPEFNPLIAGPIDLANLHVLSLRDIIGLQVSDAVGNLKKTADQAFEFGYVAKQVEAENLMRQMAIGNANLRKEVADLRQEASTLGRLREESLKRILADVRKYGQATPKDLEAFSTVEGKIEAVVSSTLDTLSQSLKDIGKLEGTIAQKDADNATRDADVATLKKLNKESIDLISFLQDIVSSSESHDKILGKIADARSKLNPDSPAMGKLDQLVTSLEKKDIEARKAHAEVVKNAFEEGKKEATTAAAVTTSDLSAQLARIQAQGDLVKESSVPEFKFVKNQNGRWEGSYDVERMKKFQPTLVPAAEKLKAKMEVMHNRGLHSGRRTYLPGNPLPVIDVSAVVTEYTGGYLFGLGKTKTDTNVRFQFVNVGSSETEARYVPVDLRTIPAYQEAMKVAEVAVAAKEAHIVSTATVVTTVRATETVTKTPSAVTSTVTASPKPTVVQEPYTVVLTKTQTVTESPAMTLAADESLYKVASPLPTVTETSHLTETKLLTTTIPVTATVTETQTATETVRSTVTTAATTTVTFVPATTDSPTVAFTIPTPVAEHLPEKGRESFTVQVGTDAEGNKAISVQTTDPVSERACKEGFGGTGKLYCVDSFVRRINTLRELAGRNRKAETGSVMDTIPEELNPTAQEILYVEGKRQTPFDDTTLREVFLHEAKHIREWFDKDFKTPWEQKVTDERKILALLQLRDYEALREKSTAGKLWSYIPGAHEGHMNPSQQEQLILNDYKEKVPRMKLGEVPTWASIPPPTSMGVGQERGQRQTVERRPVAESSKLPRPASKVKPASTVVKEGSRSGTRLKQQAGSKKK